MSSKKQVRFYLSGVDILDPFYACRIEVVEFPLLKCSEPLVFPTAEHAFQWFKFWNPDGKPKKDKEMYDIRLRIQNAVTPNEAKRIAKEEKGNRRSDWNEIKIAVAEEIFSLKFNQVRDVRLVCAGLAGSKIIEASPDPFWGEGDDGNGENYLGKIIQMYISMNFQKLEEEFPDEVAKSLQES
jgi:ribA/ribD-fused uncharacterized protein